jgi:hypothetical protein
MTLRGDVHVGDIGTLFHLKIQDDGAPFDPTTATSTLLVCKTPLGLVERECEVVHVGAQWYLDYETVPVTDVTFHARKGTYSVQGFIEFANGKKYSTNIETYVVEKNLR